MGTSKESKSAKPRKPRRRKPRAGEVVNCTEPVWEPLLGLARVYVDEFMWMGEIELEHGVRLQAYKHYWTRRYLHLDPEGNPWVFREDGRYEPWVYELLDLFNRVVLWHYPGQHDVEWEENRERRREREEAGLPPEDSDEQRFVTADDYDDVPF